MAQEHEAVDDQRVLAGLEQLAEPHLAAVRRLLEAVVVGNDTAWGQRAPLGGHVFDRPRKRASASSGRSRWRRYSSDSPGKRMAGSMCVI
jgi:hypothetical protein